ncbi:lantibiotic dehydratase [Streptomyces sp. NPDC026672]|uniref:lantibiotic dehydratase n=1 Tax=unclassified Streptomyces TaxID=2593676 RepID=UPI0033DFC783
MFDLLEGAFGCTLRQEASTTPFKKRNDMSGDGVKFYAATSGMVRIPLLSRAATDITLADPDPQDREQVERYIDALLANPRIAEALAVSSPSLYRSVEALRAGAAMKPGALRKLTLSATRYFLRAASRPTPFGLLAGVAPVDFGEVCEVRLGTAHRKAVHPDSSWLIGIVSSWELEATVLRKLRVLTNDLGFRRGRRWTLPFAARPEETLGLKEQDHVEEVSVRYTPAVRTTLEAARHPCLFGDLLRRLDEAYPQVAVSAKERLILDLVRQGFILTELRPPLTETSPLRHVINTLKTIDEPEKVDALTSVSDKLEGYGSQPIGKGFSRWREAVDSMRSLHREDHEIHVDMRIDADITLPAEVLEEAERAAVALSVAAPDISLPPHLKEYHEAFVERYGVGTAVPLQDVLDPQTGLGVPAGYNHPRSERRSPERSLPDLRRREAILTDLAFSSISSGAREIVLTESELRRFREAKDGEEKNFHPMELCAHLAGSSPEAVERGEFTLVVSPTTGSTSPGNILGRFEYLLDDRETVRDLVRRSAEFTAHRDALRAQLDFAPLSARLSNIARVRALWPDTIAVGCYADRSSPTVHGMADLALAADRRRLYIVDKASNREILPRYPSMLNPRLTPAAVQLLREIPEMGRHGWPLWEWGDISVAPYLPRVRYGRSVLAPARWRLADPALAEGSASDTEWNRALDQWRERWDVPDRIAVGTGDQRVELDLGAPLHRRLLRRELVRRRDVVAHETPQDAGQGEGWLSDDSGAFSSELVIALFPAPPAERPPAARPRPRVAISPQHGREWVYGKLYSPAARHNQILTDHLPSLLAALPEGIDRWFFIRYTDPDAHLRLRFHGDPAVLHGKLTPLLLDWAQQLRHMRLTGTFLIDTYEPEADRYGGPDALVAAERFFHHDSTAVLEQLRLLASRTVEAESSVLAAGNYLSMVKEVHGDRWTDWFLASPRADEHQAYVREHRRAAVRLLEPDGLRNMLGPAGEKVLTAVHARTSALGEYGAARQHSVLMSLLHMHHNRAVSTRRSAEERSYAVARDLAQIEHGRRTHRSGREQE